MTIQDIIYPNGFRLIYEQNKNNTSITSIYAFCNLGPGNEPSHLKGASHFIEHMCFKGTKEIPKAKNISLVYDKIGAYFNAFTNKRYTCYTIDCESKFSFHCIKILADMMLNSTFNIKEYEKERQVVIEENVNDENDPEELAYNEVSKILFDGSSFNMPIDTIDYHKKKNSLVYKDVIELYKAFYLPSNIILSIVSNLSFKEFTSILSKTDFIKNNSISTFSKQPFLSYNLTPKDEISYVLKQKKGLSNNTLIVGFRVCGFSNEDKYALTLLNHCIGKTLSGRLKYILREEKGLVYGASIDEMYFKEFGSYSFTTQTEYNKLIKTHKQEGVLNVLIDIIRSLIKNGINQKELTTGKGNIKGNLLLEIQNNSNIALHNGEHFIYDNNKTNIVPFKDLYSKIYKHLTLSQINRVIKKYFKPENMCICIVGNKNPSLSSVKEICNKIK